MPARTVRRLCCLLLAAAAWPAPAFVRVRHPTNGNVLRRGDFAAINMQINQRTAAGLTNASGGTIITSGSNPLGALRAAMDSWSNISASAATFAPPGATAEESFRVDGQHILSFADNPANRALVGDALAVTVVLFSFLGDIIETDIIFTSTKTFSTDNTPGTYDLQSVATHELGHALGAGHSGLLAATMFQATRPNSPIQGRLTSDDEAFLISAYPEPGAAATLGTVTGVVRSLLNRDIFGALLVAVDPATGVAVGSISQRDGIFVIPAVPPGNYIIYAEPANGPVTAANLPGFYGEIDIDFHSAFSGGSQQPATIQVTAGSLTTHNLTVVDDIASRNFEFAATTSVGGTDLSNVTTGPLLVRAGETFDLLVAGPGLDSTTIVENDLVLLGAGLSIRAGSLRRSTALFARPTLRMTVQASAGAPYGTGTLVLKGVREAIAHSAGLKVVAATAGPGPGATPPTLALSAGTLIFRSVFGTGVVRPSSGQIVTMSGTSGLMWSALATTLSGGNWLTVAPATGTLPANLEVLVAPADLLPGTYGGQVGVTAPGVSTQGIEVILVVEPPPPPVILEGGIVNAASFVGGGLVAGEIFSILGSDLGPRQGVTAGVDAARALPFSLANVKVFAGGIPVPLFYVSFDQINAQAPWELAGQAAAEVVVEYQGRQSERRLLRVIEARPGIFTYGPSQGLPALHANAYNEDGSRNSPLNPAAVGSVLQVFLTGQGTVAPAATTGRLSPSAAPFPTPTRPVRAFVGGVEAAVQFAGLAPDQIGVLQVNLVIPPGPFPPENVPLLILVGNAASPSNVTVAVR